MVLRYVGVLSAGKVMGALGALVGLMIGGIMSLIAAAGVAINGSPNGPQLPAIFVGLGAAIFVPIFYGFFGFISGVIYAALYNLIANLFGGLELHFEAPRTSPPQA